MKMRWILTIVMGLAAVGAQALTVDEAVRAALDESPDAQAAMARVESARAMYNQAQAAYYPWLDASLGYARTDNPGQALFMQLNQHSVDFMGDLNNPPDTDNTRASLSAQYQLYNGGKSRLDTGMARQGLSASKESLAAVRNQLIHEVTRGYYGVLQAGAFVEVQEASVKSIEESLRVAGERFAAGGTVKTDVLNLEVQLAQAREDLIRASNGVQLAVAALNAGIGKELATAGGLEKPAGELPPPPETNDLTAVEARPEFRAVTLMKGVQRNRWQKAKREYLPVVNAFGSYDNDTGRSDWESSYMVGVQAQLNLFDGFRTRQGSRVAKAEYASAVAQVEKARHQLTLDITQAYLGAREAWQRLDVAQRSVASAEEALRITQEQYKSGGADITVLMTAQVGLTATRTRSIAARYDYYVARSNLSRARGEAVEPYLKQEPITQ